MQVRAKARPEFGVRERQFDVGLQEAFLAAAIVALAFVPVGEDALVLQQPGDAVGELDLAADAARLARDLLEDRWRQHVAAGNAEARRRVFGRRLLDEALDLHESLVDRLAADDAVAARLLGWHFLHRD